MTEAILDSTIVEKATDQELSTVIRDADAFETYFKKKAVSAQMGKGEWKADGKKGHRFTLPDGSYIRLKFFDTVKKIYNTKNIEVPGRESYLSYIDVIVMPAGIKGYGFQTTHEQHVWGFSQSKALEKHRVSLAKLYALADALGIDLNQLDSWETYYAGKH
jgi:hypothetical protein